MKSRAAVAFAAGEPLEVVEIDVADPKAGEVMVRITHTALCHTDAYTLSGHDPEGLFPVVLGHEGIGVVGKVMRGDLLLDHFITHTIPFEDINAAFALPAKGESIRTVMHC